MLKVKSYNTSRILAEMEDISTWPTKKDGRAFKPGYFYSLGQITQPFEYTFEGGSDASMWAVSFYTGNNKVKIVHPQDVSYTALSEVPANCRVELYALQDGGVKYITHVFYPIEPEQHVVNGVIQDDLESFCQIIKRGRGPQVYSVGDSIPIKLNGQVTVYMQIAGFETDPLSNDSTNKCKVALIAKNMTNAPLPFSKIWVGQSGNGVASSANWGSRGAGHMGYLRGFLIQFVFTALPEILKQNIVSVTKTHPAYDTDTKVGITQTTEDKIWIPSKVELSSGGIYAGVGATPEKLIRGTIDGVPKAYWLRGANIVSGGTTSSDQVDIVTETGTFGTLGVTNNSNWHIIFGFCL